MGGALILMALIISTVLWADPQNAMVWVVTAVTAHPSAPLEEEASRGRITLHRRPYQDGDLVGAFLAVAATTEDVDLSGRIAEEAKREGVLLNVVDITPLCTWIAPAIVRRGDLTVAISTNGLSPAMARFAKDQVDESLPEEYGSLLEIVAEVRTGVLVPVILSRHLPSPLQPSNPRCRFRTPV